MTAEPDQWSRWLLERRDAGDQGQRSVSLEHLGPVRDRVLSYAEPLDGATLLDVGTGDGLIGLEALDRVGAHGSVIFSDISAALLEQCQEAVSARGLLDRARFVSTRAEDLAEIPDASVDVITTRSVLIYVADKGRAFAALHRALRAGGRISLFEPINRLMFPEPADRFWGYDIDVDPGSPTRAISLEALLDSAPNPLAPTLRESISAALTAPEQERFLRHLALAVDEGDHVRRSAVAYLTGRKPD